MNKRQIVVLALVLVIITAGVLQYNLGDTSYSSTDDVDEKLGEAVYVDNLNTDNLVNVEDKKEEEENKEDKKVQEASKTVNDYFVQAKLERDTVRSREKEELKNITTEVQADKETKSKAYDSMIEIINRAEIEMKVESLIKQKSFEDALVYFGEDGSIDLIVKAQSLSPAQTAQICDVVCRHANVNIEDIHIKNMY